MQQGTLPLQPGWLSGLVAWLEFRGLTSGWRAYVFALLAVGLTAIVRWLINIPFDSPAPLLPFLVPVVAVAFLAGFWPAVFATVVGGFVALRFFSGALPQLSLDEDAVVVSVLFVAEGVLLSWAGAQARKLVVQLIERDRQLASNEESLRMAQQAARIATYEWDPKTGETVWSPNAEEIMAMQPGSFLGTFDDALRTVLLEDRPLVEAAAEQLVREGSNEVDYRIAGSAGQLRWIHATGTLVGDGDHSARRAVGVMMDVSERRAAAEHNAFLADATARLGSSMDYRANVAGIAEAAVPRFCTISSVVLIRDGRVPGEVVSVRHADPRRQQLVERVRDLLEQNPEKPGVLAQAIRSGTPLFVSGAEASQLEDFAVSPEHREALGALQLSAAICIPLSARGTTFGGLVFAQDMGRGFSQADFDVAVEVGRRASVAIENGLLLEQSFEREAEVIRKNSALQLIADAGIELSATLDLDETLDSLARLIVPRFADVCTIAIVEAGKLQPVAAAGATPELENAVTMLRDVAPDRELYETASQVLRSNRPIYLPAIPPELYDRLASTEAQSGVLERIAPVSLITMPLSARSQTIGAMTFIRVEGSPPFDRQDLSLAGQMARRTAVSADNARLYTEARRANDAKDEFLGMMSHELRTPITVIHGGARVLRSRGTSLDEESRNGLLGDIEREAERLSRMLENLLALARAELDREVMLEPVLLQRLVPRLVSMLESGTGRKIRLEAETELPAVAAEPGYIEHIVRNLVGNAMKYSPPDAEIDVCITPHLDGASVQVLDRGFGIAPEETQRIFERFYRSDRTSRLAGGAGLGLAVCKRLVEAMSGEIWAAPRDGGGLVVGFNLPPYREEIAEL